MELAHVARDDPGRADSLDRHEVNQPLAAIVTNGEVGLQWLDREVPDLAEVREALGDMISNGRRANEIIQRLRALSRKTETQKVALDINSAISEVTQLVQPEVLSHRVSLRLELAPTLPSVLGDRVQLQQVIINLIVNGMEAMASISDRPRELVVRSQLDETGQVLIAVQNSGVGIDPENANKFFSAFFTTKPSGMGMGLSICRSIVEAHGGRVWACANKPRGAVFRFHVALRTGRDRFRRARPHKAGGMTLQIRGGIAAPLPQTASIWRRTSSHAHLNRDHPVGTPLYTISCMHCMTVSLAQNGEGLGAMWGRERAEEMMREAGFRSVEVHELPHDFQNYYYICPPPDGGLSPRCLCCLGVSFHVGHVTPACFPAKPFAVPMARSSVCCSSRP